MKFLGLVFFLAFSGSILSAQTLDYSISVSPNPVASGSSALVSIHTSTHGSGNSIAASGTCEIQSTTTFQVSGSFFFSTNALGDASHSLPTNLYPDSYAVACSNFGYTPPYYTSTTGYGYFDVEPGLCSGKDATTIASNQTPNAITWNFRAELSDGSYSDPFQESGYGVTGQQTGLYDCDVNPLTTSAAAPSYQSLGYTQHDADSVTFSWTITNYNLVTGPACTEGYCNGYQSLTTQGTVTNPYSITAYCSE